MAADIDSTVRLIIKYSVGDQFLEDRPHDLPVAVIGAEMIRHIERDFQVSLFYLVLIEIEDKIEERGEIDLVAVKVGHFLLELLDSEDTRDRLLRLLDQHFHPFDIRTDCRIAQGFRQR